MAAFDDLQRASFDGIEFPISSCDVEGGLRDHVHEYPHSPGGAPEKLGRKLYTIRMEGVFDTRIRGYNPNLWPADLEELRDRFEREVTADLVIPFIGTIKAYCVTWSQHATPERRSGETASFEFREDQSQAFLFSGLVAFDLEGNRNAMEEFTVAFEPYMAGSTIAPTGVIVPPPASATTPPRAVTKAQAFSQFRASDATLIQQITTGFNEALSLADRGELYAGLVQSKAQSVISACSRAYTTIEILKNPLAWKALRGLKTLWKAARDLYDNAAGRTNRILLYRVAAPMSVQDISRAIYGDTERAILLLKLNAFPDAYRIERDTLVRYFDPETLRGVTPTAV